MKLGATILVVTILFFPVAVLLAANVFMVTAALLRRKNKWTALPAYG